MNVNLLPMKPTTKRYQWPIALAAFVVILSFSVLVGWRYHVLDQKVIQTEQQLEQKKQLSTELLSKDKKLGPAALAIAEFMVEAEALADSRIPWITIMDSLSEQLPENGYLLEVITENTGEFSITGQFAHLNEVAGFIQSLQKNPIFEAITLGEATIMSSVDLTGTQPAVGYQFTMNIKVNAQGIEEKVE